MQTLTLNKMSLLFHFEAIGEGGAELYLFPVDGVLDERLLAPLVALVVLHRVAPAEELHEEAARLRRGPRLLLVNGLLVNYIN